MSSAADLTSAIVAAQSAATALINEKVAVDAALVSAVADLNTAGMTIAGLQNDNQVLADQNDALREEIARLQAIIDGGPVDPPPDPAPLAGRSASNNDHGPLTQCDVVRVYSFGAVDSQISESGAKALFLSDGQSVRTAAQLDVALSNLFAKHPDTLVYYCRDNEITASQLTQQQADAHNAEIARMRTVVDKYPNAYLGIDITAFGVRQGRHTILKPCAKDLDFILASCYNPGRGKNPPVWDPYSDYLDPILDVVADWGVKAFGVGEYGNPVDPRSTSQRPDYAFGAVTFVRDGCKTRGITYIGGTWWDQQKSGGPDNKLSTDNPLTAQAWKDAHA